MGTTQETMNKRKVAVLQFMHANNHTATSHEVANGVDCIPDPMSALRVLKHLHGDGILQFYRDGHGYRFFVPIEDQTPPLLAQMEAPMGEGKATAMAEALKAAGIEPILYEHPVVARVQAELDKADPTVWVPENERDLHPDHPIGDWVYDVNHNLCRQSYVDWVNTKLASNAAMVTRRAPYWAWDVIDETLALDAQAKNFDADTRQSIQNAVDAMEDVD